MDLNTQKEQFSKAYVRAVVAAAGYTCYTTDVDDDSIDLTIAVSNKGNLLSRPKVDVQLKCSARSILGEQHLSYPLKIKNYDDLRNEYVSTPRILIVVLVPEDVEDWLEHTEDRLILCHCGYWASIRGQPDSPNTETVTVHLPRSQQITPAALQQLMQKINDKVSL